MMNSDIEIIKHALFLIAEELKNPIQLGAYESSVYEHANDRNRRNKAMDLLIQLANQL